jgi:hypothetical protein
MGMQSTIIKLATQLSMLNIFDAINAAYNWSSLWFIPYLLLFMLIICLLDKYVKNLKLQLTIVTAVWLGSMMLWVFESPFRLGELFSQFLLVFALGFYLNKLKLYEKMFSYKTAAIALPVIALFSIDFTTITITNPFVSALWGQLYFNCRSILLTVGLVLLALLLLRKLRAPKNGFAKQIAKRSAFIYLAEPFISFLILSYIFGKADTFFDSGPEFYLYMVVRVVVLLGLLPLCFMAWKKIKQPTTEEALSLE